MNDPLLDEGTTLISVAGDAQRFVEPDRARFNCSISVAADSRVEATQAVGRAHAAVIEGLGAFGGRPYDVHTRHQSLTWSTPSVSVRPEMVQHETRGWSESGRQVAQTELDVRVRDFALLQQVAGVLSSRFEVSIGSVHWSADHDNPGWAEVRADAIRAALLKGQDYTRALGGEVLRVVHVADEGLLGAGDGPGRQRRSKASMSKQTVAFGLAAGDEDWLDLDPVPQQLGAVIEAQLVATIGPLPS